MGRLTFLAPIAGLIAGAVGAGLVLLMYMLKLRRRPMLVSSTLLWKRAVKDLEGNIPWQRLSPTMLLFLHLLIVLLLALAIARPVMDSDLGDGQRVALVIDTSASMNAIDGDSTLFENAKRDAAERVRGLFDSGRSPRVSVIDAGLEPRIVLRDGSERGRVLGVIEGLAPSEQGGRIEDAIDLIERLQPPRIGEDAEGGPSEQTLVWVFSDGGSIERDSIPMRGGVGTLVPSASGEGLSNLGIVSLSAQRDRVETDICRVFVRVLRSDAGPGAGVVRVFEDDALIETAPIAFEQGQRSATHTFELRLVRGALLRVELGAGDDLGSDDRAWVEVPGPEPIAVTVIAPDGDADPLLVDALEVIARAPVRVITPDDVVGLPDLIVYDRVDADALPGVASLGFDALSPGIGARLAQPSGLRRVLSWARDDPMLQYAGIGSVSYVRSVRFDEQREGTRVLAQDQDGPIMIELAQRGVRHVRVGFALHDSDWAVQVGFTVFLAQLCEQLLPGAGGSGMVYRTNEVLAYRDEQGIERSAGPFPQTGVQALPDGTTIGVSLLDERETALGTRESLRIGASSDATGTRLSGRVRVDLWRWFVGIAIGLLLLEWVLYIQKVRIAS